MSTDSARQYQNGGEYSGFPTCYKLWEQKILNAFVPLLLVNTSGSVAAMT
jgi:hypothetical protein